MLALCQYGEDVSDEDYELFAKKNAESFKVLSDFAWENKNLILAGSIGSYAGAWLRTLALGYVGNGIGQGLIEVAKDFTKNFNKDDFRTLKDRLETVEQNAEFLARTIKKLELTIIDQQNNCLYHFSGKGSNTLPDVSIIDKKNGFEYEYKNGRLQKGKDSRYEVTKKNDFRPITPIASIPSKDFWNYKELTYKEFAKFIVKKIAESGSPSKYTREEMTAYYKYTGVAHKTPESYIDDLRKRRAENQRIEAMKQHRLAQPYAAECEITSDASGLPVECVTASGKYLWMSYDRQMTIWREIILPLPPANIYNRK